MDISGDFETAIEFGAPYVRVRSAIFGEQGGADRHSEMEILSASGGHW
jgi:hypothetical protein